MMPKSVISVRGGFSLCAKFCVSWSTKNLGGDNVAVQLKTYTSHWHISKMSTILFIPLLLTIPHSPHPLPAPCNASSSPRCIRHTKESIRVYLTIYKETYFTNLQSIESVSKGWKTNADLDHLHNLITYILNSNSSSLYKRPSES